MSNKKNHFREISLIYLYYSCSTPDTSSYIRQGTNLLAPWYILQLTPISSRSVHWVTVGGLIHFRKQTKIVFEHDGEFPTHTPVWMHWNMQAISHAIQQRVRYSNVPSATASVTSIIFIRYVFSYGSGQWPLKIVFPLFLGRMYWIYLNFNISRSI
jgi:hypothetical protein